MREAPQAAHPRVDALRATLDLGEASAIVLAEDLGAELLLCDDLAGRRLATERGLTVTGTLGVLLRAKRGGGLDAVRPILARMLGMGFRVSPALVDFVLHAAGEVPIDRG